MILLIFCHTGNIENTHNELVRILVLHTTTSKTLCLAKNKRKKEKSKEGSQSEARRDAQYEAKVTALHQMGKDDSKTMHRSKKMSTIKPSKSKIDRCTRCCKLGHKTKTRNCLIIKVKKRSRKNKNLTNWNVLYSKPSSKKFVNYQTKVKL